MIYGIDEAGRGPILGPMVLAIVGLTPAGTRRLRSLGVDDSKRFGSGASARARRAELAAQIREFGACVHSRSADAEEVDRYVLRGELNVLERRMARELLARAGAEPESKIICDGATMFAPLREEFPSLRAVNRGESHHASVAAASIIAKHVRDLAFERIATRYADRYAPVTGGGYLNAATRRFLDAYIRDHGEPPPEARRTWMRNTAPPSSTSRAVDKPNAHGPGRKTLRNQSGREGPGGP